MARLLLSVAALAVLASACAPDETQDATSATAPLEVTGGAAGPSFEVPLPPRDLFDPVEAGEELPQGYRRSLPRDAIFPVYDPSFVAASLVGWPDDLLVIGVHLRDEARAYPVGFLNRREIVIDDHRGIPTLVTW